MLHFTVGCIPQDAKPEKNALQYDAWLFSDVKTWNGAHRRAQRYAKHTPARDGMRTVLYMYTCSTVDGTTPPVRWAFL